MLKLEEKKPAKDLLWPYSFAEFFYCFSLFRSRQQGPVRVHFKRGHPLLDVLKHLLDVRLLKVEVQSGLVLPQGDEVDLGTQIETN